ncbi:hypothetical protein NMG60_11014932 [Bertholletia excelsa]
MLSASFLLAGSMSSYLAPPLLCLARAGKYLFYAAALYCPPNTHALFRLCCFNRDFLVTRRLSGHELHSRYMVGSSQKRSLRRKTNRLH